ncbi:MAG: carbamoyl-phosphate synthase large subunit [Thermodesulfobacteriota bacterium]|jgi:carbamoyl-phosphate synthase large subunit|nr:MAG: carbamoyl-phosphate synthase large subunit [Thermodesulfobacteriota bacterium]
MPKRTDIKKILVIGSGPIIIGQACEFDYSGTQACKALKEEGYHVVLVNSNPATIMTDPEVADSTYIEPVNASVIADIIAQENPDKKPHYLALLPTIGGQTGLNAAIALGRSGVLEEYNVALIGAKLDAIMKAEDRELFKKSMDRIGLSMPQGEYVYNLREALKAADELGYPVILRPAFNLGGTGGGIAFSRVELEGILRPFFKDSQFNQVLIEKSVIGWKEYELEVMRDLNDNVVIICSIENFDPMGIHTGDSITVAPAQTLTDKEYQRMRNAAIAVIREIGVETGGSNIQFAINPENGEMLVIEMNPRVSRSSALASKATGFPIAKIAAKLAIGYTLDEIPNDITRYTKASFEPVIDYVVTKIPRWAFDKFPETDQTLNTQMKSVGEIMAIGRTFKESFQKAIRSLEIGYHGLEKTEKDHTGDPQKSGKTGTKKSLKKIREKLKMPNWERIFYIAQALRVGMTIEEINDLTKIDPWFLFNIKEILDLEIGLSKHTLQSVPPEQIRKAKQFGFSDIKLAEIFQTDEISFRTFRKSLGIEAVFKMVDTCSAEFEAYTPYYYSTYETEDEAKPSDKPKVMILGGGPNRIGQGIEFDYCCVHAALALKEVGYEVIMVNCNPETVSTDYDTSDRLFFEPLTREDILNIIDREKPMGVIVQFGGQTPLNLALPLKEQAVPILGTDPENIDLAEDRERFKAVIEKLNLEQPKNGCARSYGEAKEIAQDIGYPVVVRPSYVLGGRSMEVVYDEGSLNAYMDQAVKVSLKRPVLIDKFLEDAIEVDVDAIADGERVVIAGLMEHIEEAGVHSGDSTCVLPPYTITEDLIKVLKEQTHALGKELNVKGLMNIQYAIKNDIVYVLEVNPRASRTIPFVSKATGIPWAKVASLVMVGYSLKDLGIIEEYNVNHVSVKESVFPFSKFPGVDSVLGPEMKSTGEVMGIDDDFGIALSKAQMGASQELPLGKRFGGTVFISVKNKDKRVIVFIAKKLHELGFRIVATEGTTKALRKHGVPVSEVIGKVYEKSRGATVVDRIHRLEVDLIINTPQGKGPYSDNYIIRQQAIINKVPCFTTISAAAAAVNAIESVMRQRGLFAEEETLRQRIEKSSAPALFISVDYSHHNENLISLARIISKIKPTILATKGTADFLAAHGIKVENVIPRISEGEKHTIIEYMEKGKVAFILNVIDKKDENAISDGFIIRRVAVSRSIPYLTNIEECLGEFQHKKQLALFKKRIKNLQDYHHHINIFKPKNKVNLRPCILS